MLSTKICRDCNSKLESSYFLKQDLIAKQENLYKLLDDQRVEKSVEYDDEVRIKLDPEVKIKSELDFNNINGQYEGIDDDVQSGKLFPGFRFSGV